MAKRVPSYCLHKASGKAVVRISGKDHYLGAYGIAESKRAYKRLIGEWESAGRSAAFGMAEDQTTIAMLWVDYRDHCDVYYPKSRKSEAVMVRIAFRFMVDYEDIPVSQFGAKSLIAVRDAMLGAIGARGKPLSRKYINKQISRIVRCFAWGVSREMVEPQVVDKLRAVEWLKLGRTTAPETAKITGVTDAVVAATLPHCSTIVADMIRVQQMTGMRPGEVVSLTPAMVDRSGDVWVATLAQHKTAYRGTERMVYIGPQAQAYLSKYLLRPADSPLFSPAEAEAERRAKQRAERVTPPSCGNRTRSNVVEKPKRQPGIAYTAESYNRAVQYACAKEWPIPDGATKEEASAWRAKWWWSTNQLRHAAATRIRKAYGIEAAQVILGHSKIDMTQHYAAANRERGSEVAALVG